MKSEYVMQNKNNDEVSITTLVGIFMLSKSRNMWLENKYMRVYVRKGYHMVNDTCIKTFDVANVSVYPKYQKQGYFKTFMQYIESLGRVIYVESINNPNLKVMLIKNGYTVDESGYNAYKKC